MFTWWDFHFLRPWWLLLLPAAVLALILGAKHARKSNSWNRVIDEHLLPYLFHHVDKGRPPIGKSVWRSLCLLLIIVALAGPTLKKIPNDIAFYKAPVIVCLEVSPHMLAKDLNPNRLRRAMFKLEDLLRVYNGAEVALIAFAGDAHLVVPLSNDYNTVLSMAKTLSPDLMPVKGVNIGKAIEMAEGLTAGNPRSQIVVMTSSNADDSFATWSKILKHRATIWAFATDAGGPLEMADGRFAEGRNGQVSISRLQRGYLASLSGVAQTKTLVATADSSDVDAIVAGLAGYSRVKNEREIVFDQWYDLGPYVVALAILVFLGGVFFARENFLLGMLLLCLLPSSNGEAGVLDWFWRKDQQAQDALENNRPKDAADLFDDDFRKGSAHYRAKNYDEAIKHLSRVNSADGRYNLGNAYAQKGQYQEAISAYDEALKIDPLNADAKANKALVEKMQQQQSEQSSSQKDGEQPKEDKPDQSPNEKADGNNQSQQDQQSNGQEPNENKQNGDKSTEDKKRSDDKAQQNADKSADEQKKTNEQNKQNAHEEKPAENKPGEKKTSAQADTQLDKELDPQTRYYFQRLEQNNNQFLKRKFLYESQKERDVK